MSYTQKSEAYRDPNARGRYEMAIGEQAHLTYANDPDPANAALADQVIKGDVTAIDSLMRAITVGPNSETLDDDASLLGAVQAAWSVTAQAWSEG